MHSKATTISRSRTFPSNPSLGFFLDSKVRKYLPFSRLPGKTHPPWGNLIAPDSAPRSFLPFLLPITYMSHQTSRQSLQEMHSLPPAREKAATTQSCNLVTVCNELMGKYFCLIRILNELLIIMSGSWLASCSFPICNSRADSSIPQVSFHLSPAGRGIVTLHQPVPHSGNSKSEILLVLIYQPSL